MGEKIGRIRNIQAAALLGLALVSLLPYVIKGEALRAILWLPFYGLLLSWAVMTVAALIVERSFRTLGPVHTAHGTALLLLFLAALANVKGWAPPGAQPAAWAVSLAAVAAWNFRAASADQTEAEE